MYASVFPMKSGDVQSIKGQTQKQQKQTIADFKTGGFNVLVATSIAEEGLDVGYVDLIVSYGKAEHYTYNITLVHDKYIFHLWQVMSLHLQANTKTTNI